MRRREGEVYTSKPLCPFGHGDFAQLWPLVLGGMKGESEGWR